MKEYRYHLRDGKDAPRITVVILEDAGYMARGVSICSMKDNPVKKEGYNIARGRAMRAFKKQKDDMGIYRDEALEVLEMVDPHGYFTFQHKSSYNPILNFHEQSIVERAKNVA